MYHWKKFWPVASTFKLEIFLYEWNQLQIQMADLIFYSDHHHIVFKAYCLGFPRLGSFLWRVSVFLSFARSLLVFLFLILHFLPFISDYLIPCFRRLRYGDTATNFDSSTFILPIPFFIISIWSNHCRHSLVLFSFRVVLSSSAEVQSSGQTLYIHITVVASYFSSLITFSSISGYVLLKYSITLCTYAEYNLF